MDELVEDGSTGFLVKPFDTRAFADKILFLLNDPGKAAEMGMAGREKVKSSYTREQFVNNMREFYNRIGG
jgi:glycosyltransferase involved in cell wall biosynthesis